MNAAANRSEQIDHLAARWVARRDAGLNSTEQAELSTWLRADARHQAAFDRFEATWTTVGRPRQAGATAGLARELAALQRRRRTRTLAAAAAAAVLLVATGVLWNARGRRTDAPAESQIVISMPEQRRLPDGTTVELKSGAEIAVDFSAAWRRVRLVRGEAHFAVAKNPARPFVVDASGVSLRAVGTAFAVKLEENSVDLLVTEGRVSVDHPAAQSVTTTTASLEKPLAFVDAGQQVDVAANAAASGPLQVRTVAAEELAARLAWRIRRAEFSGTPLSEVVALLNRYTKERFVIDDAELARVPLSGLFRLDDSEAFVHLLETGFDVKAENRGANVIVLRKSTR